VTVTLVPVAAPPFVRSSPSTAQYGRSIPIARSGSSSCRHAAESPLPIGSDHARMRQSLRAASPTRPRLLEPSPGRGAGPHVCGESQARASSHPSFARVLRGDRGRSSTQSASIKQ
jgi:hypothetical protein